MVDRSFCHSSIYYHMDFVTRDPLHHPPCSWLRLCRFGWWALSLPRSVWSSGGWTLLLVEAVERLLARMLCTRSADLFRLAWSLHLLVDVLPLHTPFVASLTEGAGRRVVLANRNSFESNYKKYMQALTLLKDWSLFESTQLFRIFIKSLLLSPKASLSHFVAVYPSITKYSNNMFFLK